MTDKPTYYSQQRNELVKYIPESISKSLDVGCGRGVFSTNLKQKFNHEAWGIEMTEEASEEASSKLDNVLTGTFEENYESLPKNYFNCIFFNDVLEHMVDPFTVLNLSKELLTDDGVIICSIPNVRYFPNLFELIALKDWRYRDAGILDRTHLRFFTEKSIHRMFEELNYDIVKIEGINKLRSKKYKLPYFLLNFISFGSISDTNYQQYACIIKFDKQST